MSRRLAAMPSVEVLLNATAVGLYEGNLVAVAQGEMLIELRAGQIVIATGAFEHPLVFQNNDLPGVMLGSAATRLVRHWGVAPGTRAVVVSAHDEGLRVALDLLQAGIEIAAVAEHRTQVPDSPELRALRAKGVRMFAGWSIAEAGGAGAVERATLVKLDGTGRPIAGSERRGRCDLIALSTGLETNASLLWQAGCTVEYDPDLDLFTPRGLAPGIQAAGDVTGVRDLRVALLGGHCAGLAAAIGLRTASNGHAGALTAVRAELETLERRFRERVRARPIAAVEGEGRKRFVCPCEDVTVKDVDWAVAEGFDHIETLKRYSTVTMGPCQGKMCAMNAVQACARATGRSIGETGTTTSRPLVQPVSLGTLAGPHLDPTRLTPMHQRHLELGAVLMDAGQWKRPRHYTSPEDECRAVRERVGIIDVSTLGKIDLQGRDAIRLLERIYTNRWADLKVGRVRYGLMTDESGIIMDDGTVARLAGDHFLITTTSSGVASVEEWLTWWMEGTGWCAHVANVTSGLAAVNLAGPRSREVLARLTELDISAAALPYLAAARATVAGIPAIILRIGFVGELGYELHVPAQHGEYFWDALMEAGKDFGITPFGLEAQRILRLEKGHIIVTQDTDALSTPLEADMAWVVKLDKDDFIGKTSLANLKEAGMGQKLVGFEMEDPRQVPEEGCQIVREDGFPVGRVTSARSSPTLGKALGLAWMPAAQGAEGTTIRIRRDDQFLPARVVRVPFYDPAGTRMRS
jgi:sarcosine oxidase subunit alpha